MAGDELCVPLQSRMVSRTAVAIVALVALAAGVYSQNDGSNTGQFINKFVPLTIQFTTTGVANFVVTPATLVSPPPLLLHFLLGRSLGRFGHESNPHHCIP